MKTKLGPNDLCPCGSGKKLKNAASCSAPLRAGEPGSQGALALSVNGILGDEVLNLRLQAPLQPAVNRYKRMARRFSLVGPGELQSLDAVVPDVNSPGNPPSQLSY